jgi:hypothetical protein
MKVFLIQILLPLIVCINSIASTVVPIVEECDDTFKPNESRRIINAAVKEDKILLFTHESERVPVFVGCFTFGQHGLLQNAHTFLLKGRPESIDSILDIYAFGQGLDIVLGGITSTHHPSIDYLWFTEPGGAVFTKPKLILQDRTDSLGKWWLLKVGKSRKLFILKSRILRSKDLASGLERQNGWLHCYNLDEIDKPKLEGVTRIDSNEYDSSWVECAADKNKEVYIWQTIHKKGEFRKNTLRVARWRSDGKLDWTICQTRPLVFFAVDHSAGSIALVIELVEMSQSMSMVPDSHISLAKAGTPKINKIGFVPGDRAMLRLQLMKTKDNSYPWAGLVAPMTNDKMFLFRVTDQYEPSSTILPKPFEIIDVALVTKGSELHLFRVTKDKITLTRLED